MDWLFYFKLPAIGFVQHLASILSIPSVQAPKSLVVSPRWPPLPNSYILPWSASFTARCTFTTIFIADTFTKKETASMYDILKRDEVGSDRCSWHTCESWTCSTIIVFVFVVLNNELLCSERPCSLLAGFSTKCFMTWTLCLENHFLLIAFTHCAVPIPPFKFQVQLLFFCCAQIHFQCTARQLQPSI